MDLIDRYLATVSLLLPLRQRADIAAELRDELISRREEREAALGRALSRDEDAALLRDFGNPIAVAGRYAGRQTLIGPELYPLYLLVTSLMLAFAILAALTKLVLAVVAPHLAGEGVSLAAQNVIAGPLSIVGFLTLLFAVLDRTPARTSLLRVMDQWDPRELSAAPKRRPRASWPNHVAGIVVNLIVLVWWVNLAPVARLELPLKPGQVLELGFAPVWANLYWPVLAMIAGVIVVNALKLAGAARRRFAYAVDIAVQAVLLGIAGYALRAGHWVIVGGQGLSASDLAGADRGVNIGFLVAFISIALVAAAAIAYDAWRLARSGSAN